jgi:GAF domain-containing protein
MRGKLERYERLRQQIAGLIEGIESPVARRATAAALLHAKVPGVSWAGFYMLTPEGLTVDVYQGPLACVLLTPGKGVCWAAVESGEAQVVADVAEFPGHIPCDPLSQSEIVLPYHGPDGAVVGVLDLDSREIATFDDADREGLEAVVRVVEGE